MQQLPRCLSAHLGHGCALSLGYRCSALSSLYKLRQAKVLHVLQDGILGQDVACQEWDEGRGLLLFTSCSSSSCRRGKAKSVNIYKDTEHPPVGYGHLSHCPSALKDTVLSTGWEDWHQLPQVLCELWWSLKSSCRSC